MEANEIDKAKAKAAYRAKVAELKGEAQRKTYRDETSRIAFTTNFYEEDENPEQHESSLQSELKSRPKAQKNKRGGHNKSSNNKKKKKIK